MPFKVLEVIADEAWDRFVSESPQESLFHESLVLKARRRPFRIHGIYASTTLRIAAVCLLTEDKTSMTFAPHLPHHGILLAPDVNVAEAEDLLEILISELFHVYGSVSFALSPQFADLRIFQKKHMKIELRYTALLDIRELASLEVPEDSNLFKHFPQARKSRIRASQRDGGHVVTESNFGNVEKLCKLQSLGFDPGIDPPFFLEEISLVSQPLLELNRALIFSAYNGMNELGFAALYLCTAKRAYYYFGIGDERNRKDYCGTAVHWAAFQELAKRGIEEVDFVGVNSPNRGAFKLSFGGSLMPYFMVAS